MKIKFVSISVMTLLGVSLGVSPAHSGALPGYVQEELNNTYDLINEVDEYLETVVYPQIVQQRLYEQRLHNACQAGNNNACIQLQDLERRRVQWMIQNDCVYRTGLNSCSRYR